VLLTAAGWLTTTSNADNRISCSIDLGGGDQIIVSCGSSAGNIIWECSGGSCTSDPANDVFADMLCQGIQANGCPAN